MAVILLAAFLLAVFVLPSPWGLYVVVAGAVFEIAEAWLWWGWSKRRTPAVGLETIVGRRATVTAPCRPRGQVRIAGELWTAVCPAGADTGAQVEVVSYDADGLTLHVEPARP